MKILKFALLIALIGFSTAMLGQRPQNKKGRIDHQRMAVIEFSEELGLSPTQKAAIWDVNVAHVKDLKDKKVNGELSDKEQMKAERTAYDAKINAILTPIQQNKYLELKEARNVEREERMAEIKEKRNSAKEELRSYYDANVFPVMAKKRSEFDQLLSNDEKVIIADLQAKRLERKEMWSSRKDKKGKDKQDLKKQKENGEFRKAPLGDGNIKGKGSEALNQIIDNHREDLEKIWSETSAQRVTWEADMKVIKEKNITQEMKAKGVERRPGKEKGMNRKGNENSMKWTQFLLMEVG